MAVYDKDYEKELNDLRDAERDGRGPEHVKEEVANDQAARSQDDAETDDSVRGKHKEAEAADGEKDGGDGSNGEEDESLESRLARHRQNAIDADKRASGLFREEVGKDGKSKFKGAKGQGIRGLLKRKKFLAGAAVGVVGVGLATFSIFSFLGLFKLDHILQNMDARTFSRFNAAFSGRSDKYLRAYLKLRMSEIEGSANNDTLFFRAYNVDTNNPIRDWYRTLRTGKFEQELYQKQGIIITSVALQNPDGSVTLRPGKLTARGSPDVSFADIAKYGDIIDDATNGDLTAINKFGDDLGKFFDVEIFDSDKAARKAIKTDVRENTHFFQVVKRRHVRKDIQNMTGIRSWRFFETTANKIADSKLALQQKIIRKIVPDNKAGEFLKCILGAGPCSSSIDPENPENQLGGILNGEVVAGDTDPDPVVVDENGTQGTATDPNGNQVPSTTGEFGAGATAGELENSIENSAKSEIASEAEKVGLSPLEARFGELVKSFIGGNLFTKAYSWLKKIAKIHNNLKTGKFSKMVYNARVLQLAAIYATYAISRDQSHTGQLTATEYNNLMGTIDNYQRSEGWVDMENADNGTVSALSASDTPTNLDRSKYCKLQTEEEKKQNAIQYFCNRPGDSRASAIEDAYKNSAIYDIVDPIAQVINATTSGIAGVFGKALDLFNGLQDKIVGPVLNAVLKIGGLGDKLASLTVYAMTKFAEFLGAGAFFDGTQAGAGNYIFAGSAVSAESATRDSGGVASTPLSYRYSTKLAQQARAEEKSQESLYERYASLKNPDSLLAKTAFAAANFSFSEKFTGFLHGVADLPNTFASILHGSLFAADTDITNFSAADWAGIQKYDIAQACVDLDPLDQQYVAHAVGVMIDSPKKDEAQQVVDKILPQLTFDNERDGAKFWKLVYDTIGQREDKDEIATAIYNCAILDARVQGGLGYLSGFTNDTGLNGAPLPAAGP